jgi:hypothetical protein
VQNQQAVNVLSPLKVGNIDHQHIWCQSLRQLTQRLKNNKLNDSEKNKNCALEQLLGATG